MENLIVCAARALRSLFAPGMFGTFIFCVLVTIAALFAFVGFSTAFFAWLAGAMQGSAIAEFLPWLGSIGSVIIAWLLFPGIMPVIVNFFGERIARLIEKNEYPDAGLPREAKFLTELLHDVRFSVMVILLNIIALPFYLFPLVNIILFYSLNGWLLGREFFVMVARRHIPTEQAEAIRKTHGRSIFLAGVALTILATIPVVNLVAPFWGIAVMVHLYHKLGIKPAQSVIVDDVKVLF